MIYVDFIFQMKSNDVKAFNVGKRHRHQWCHMWADDLKELVKFATKIGLKREWLQKENGRFPHFDLTPPYRAKAISYGAVEMSFKKWLRDNERF